MSVERGESRRLSLVGSRSSVEGEEERKGMEVGAVQEWWLVSLVELGVGSEGLTSGERRTGEGER